MNSVRIQNFSGPYFTAFGLNSVALHTQFKCGKIWARKTSNTDTFHAVEILHLTILIQIIKVAFPKIMQRNGLEITRG